MSKRLDPAFIPGPMMRVRCAGQYFDAAIARNEPAALAAALLRARAELGYAECFCSTIPRKLAIRKVHGLNRLAVWPLDGEHHDTECPFFQKVSTGVRGTTGLTPAVRALRSGQYDIRLDVTMVRRTEAPPTATRPGGRSTGSRARRASMPLLGLLHFLWEVSDLDRWVRGWSRDYWRLWNCVTSAAADCVVNRVPLVDMLYVPPKFTDTQREHIATGWMRFADPLQASSGTALVKSGLIIGELSAIEPTKYGSGLRLRHHRPLIYLTAEHQRQLQRRFPRATAQAGCGAVQGPRVIVAAQVEVNAAGSVKLIDAALMLTCDRYVPVDSMYEARIATELITQGRTFRKPLRLHDEDLLPDFVLEDTSPETAMEVYGMRTREYLERKRVKQEQYAIAGTPLWEWDATTQTDFPAFPPARRRRA